MNYQGKKRLLRSTDDRILAGVAGGVARYLDLDPTLVRVGFVAAVLFGGLGIVAYLVLAVVTPNDDGSGAPVEGERPSPWLVILMVIAVLVLLPGSFWGPFGWGPGWWWGGSLWLLLLAGGAVWLYVTLRDRDRRPSPPADAEPDTQPEVSEPEDSAPTTTTQRLDEPAGPAAERRTRPGWSTFLRITAITVLVLIALSAAASIAILSAWATATGHGAVVAGTVIAIGAALIVAALIGESRWRWLIVPALVLALPAGAVAAGDIRFDGGIGEREYQPASRAEIPDDGYKLGIGQMVVDLRELRWRRDRTVSVATDMGLGQTVVSVPSRVCVDADGRVTAGEVLVRGQTSSGVEAEVIEHPPEGKAPRLELDSEIDAGQLVVTDRPPGAFTGRQHGGAFDDGSAADEDERQRQESACDR